LGEKELFVAEAHFLGGGVPQRGARRSRGMTRYGTRAAEQLVAPNGNPTCSRSQAPTAI